jgi:hypothetical protein
VTFSGFTIPHLRPRDLEYNHPSYEAYARGFHSAPASRSGDAIIAKTAA